MKSNATTTVSVTTVLSYPKIREAVIKRLSANLDFCKSRTLMLIKDQQREEALNPVIQRLSQTETSKSEDQSILK
jgi:hypothetical protein